MLAVDEILQKDENFFRINGSISTTIKPLNNAAEFSISVVPVCVIDDFSEICSPLSNQCTGRNLIQKHK